MHGPPLAAQPRPASATRAAPERDPLESSLSQSDRGFPQPISCKLQPPEWLCSHQSGQCLLDQLQGCGVLTYMRTDQSRPGGHRSQPPSGSRSPLSLFHQRLCPPAELKHPGCLPRAGEARPVQPQQPGQKGAEQGV